jgi:hypothetical protein
MKKKNMKKKKDRVPYKTLNMYLETSKRETRWFADCKEYPDFDGTAQGYGYKSSEKLLKAFCYWWHNRRNIKKEIERL